MRTNKKYLKSFDNPDTVGIISSYPAKGGEIARANAISRYSYLLSKSFPQSQKVVVFCEKGKGETSPFLVGENILVVPTYQFDSPLFFSQVVSEVNSFRKIKDYLIQFEFSIFGGKKVIPSFIILLAFLKISGKNVSITIHQVVNGLESLSGHLGLSPNSFKTRILNFGIRSFYRITGLFADKIIVHDQFLKARLSKYIKEEKIIVIPHAIGDENVRELGANLKSVARDYFGFKKQEKVIAVYGYISWYKGTDWIVRAIKKINEKNPSLNLKLLVAGGESPTLKDTASYKHFETRFKRLIQDSSDFVKVTGFIPENEVWKVFAASDLIVFPYRTRMAASGALSLTLAYRKPFLVSSKFAVGLRDLFVGNVFDMSFSDFEDSLLEVFEDKIKQKELIRLAEKLSEGREWRDVARLYLVEVKSDKINWNAATILQKAFRPA